MQQLTGLDSAFLYLETPETPMHVASLHLYDLPEGFRGDFLKAIRAHIRSRLHLLPVLRRRLAPLPLQLASPVWVEDRRVDLAHHIRRATLPRPGTLAQLNDWVAQAHAAALDRNRPLWEFWLVDGLESGQVALYCKVHHATLDGASGVLLVTEMLDTTPQPRRLGRAPARGGRAGASARQSPPAARAVLGTAFEHTAGQFVKLVRSLPSLLPMLSGIVAGVRSREARPGLALLRGNFAFGPRTPWSGAIGRERSVATVSLPLDAVKAIARAHEAKVNDVVLAICSGALRRYLAAHGGVPRKPLVAAVPVSLRADGDVEFATQATMVPASLATHLADPVRRLRAIRDAAGASKSLTASARQVLPTDFPTLGLPWLLSALASLYGRTRLANAIPPIANLVISNVPGPQVPLYLAGARMRTYWPLSIVEHGLGLNITVESYSGSLDFGLVACRKSIPDLDALAAAMTDAFEELRATGDRPRRTGRGAARKMAAPAPRRDATPAPRRRASSKQPARARPAKGKGD
ncbi:MAG: wax ester/triacylglycerol synthase family O-acyltransferase [Burkholderiaceae bacterium]|nr:wax ester/triacylglycerol synthase family O-acyltransferase [Burkholderiaceae bacterium]